MRSRTSSLAGRLYRRMLLLTTLIGVVMASLTLWAAQAQINWQADGQLLTGANVLYALMQDELKEQQGGDQTLSVDDSLLSGEDLRAFRTSADWRMFVISRDGHPVMQSDTAPAMAVLPHRPGFATVDLPGGAWRVYSLAVPEAHLLIQVGERVAIRNALIKKVGTTLFLPLVLLIVGSAALLWLSLQDGLLGLRQLSHLLAHRNPRDTHRFQLGQWPSDLAPLITTLNALFERVDTALAREREFTDDAAHQLRTPLAALKLQAQVLARVEDPARQAILIAELTLAVDRATLLVSRMLTLARLDSGDMRGQTLDVAAIATDCIAELAVFATRRDIALAFDGPGQAAMIDGDETALHLILSNLIENAVRHTPVGTTVTVAVGHDDDDRVVVTVADEGPGIPDAERVAVLQRFHRGDGLGTGSGLGLAIVVGAVRNLRGTLVLEDGPGGHGLLARVTLPHPRSPPEPFSSFSFASG